MKKFFYFLCLTSFFLPTVSNCELDSWPAFDKTFFTVRSPFQTACPEKESLFYDKVFLKECGINGTMQLVPFGGLSTKGRDLGLYFSPSTITPLIVSSETMSVTPGLEQNFERAINPVHFNIHYVISQVQLGTFNSLISFNPQQQSAGLGFTYNQFLHARDACEKHWWFEVSFPFQWVRNTMRLQETDIHTTGVPLEDSKANMVDAFKGGTEPTDIKAGKINGPQNRAGVADIELKLGCKIIDTEKTQFDAYIGGILPTGNKPDGEFMFEPIIGNNKHWGIMFGSMIDLELWSNRCDKALYFRTHSHGRYLFENTQTRLLDLKNRPWSRYTLMFPNQEAVAQGVSGFVNASEILLRRLSVSPGFAFTLNTMLRYDHCNFQAELGYNFYARRDEGVQLKDVWQEGPAVGDLTNTFPAMFINRLSNIANNNTGAGIAYTDAGRIHVEDISLSSAEHPGISSHIIFAAFGYQWPELYIPVFASIGGSYEFSGLNTVLNRWLVWGKVGIAL